MTQPITATAEQIVERLKNLKPRGFTQEEYKKYVADCLSDLPTDVPIKFKEWCDENEREIRLERVGDKTGLPAVTTSELFDRYLNSKQG